MAKVRDRLSSRDIEADLAKVVQARKDGLSIDSIMQSCDLSFRRVSEIVRLAKLRKLIPAERSKPRGRPRSLNRVRVGRGSAGQKLGAQGAFADCRLASNFVYDQDCFAQEVLRQHGVVYPSLAIKSVGHPRLVEPSRFQGSSAGSSAAYAVESAPRE